MVHRTKEQLPHFPQAFSLVPLSIVRDQPSLLRQGVGMWEALVHSGRTLEVACFVDHIVHLVGIGCSKRKDFGSWDRILLADVYLEATIYC